MLLATNDRSETCEGRDTATRLSQEPAMTVRTEMLNNKYPENMKHEAPAANVVLQFGAVLPSTGDMNIGVGELQECTVSKSI